MAWTITGPTSGTWAITSQGSGQWSITLTAAGEYTSSSTPTPAATRFSTALAGATARNVAAVDPIASLTVATDALGGASDTNIAGGVDYQPNNSLIRYIGGQAYEGFAAYIWNVKQFHIDGTTPHYVNLYGQEIVTASPSVEFVINMRGQRVHLFVDGVKTNAAGYVVGRSDTSYGRYKVAFGSSATRRIRLVQEAGIPAFGAVRVEAGHTLTAPAAVRPCNGIIIGDSFWEPSFPTYAIDGVAFLLAEKLGLDNIIPAASGGTGFTNDIGAARVNYADRIVKDMTLSPTDDAQINVVIIAASGNDVSGNRDVDELPTMADWEADYSAKVTSVLSTARAAWPDATVIVLSHATKENLATADLAFMSATLSAACTAQGCVWVPGMPEALNALSEATRNSYYHVDGHPNDAGHAWLADTWNTLIRGAL